MSKKLYFPPVQPIERYVVWGGCGFMDRGYENAVGAIHPGVDLNLVDGGDSDLGAPVFAVTNGKVVAARHYPVWGNVLLLECPGPGVWLQYAHLKDILVDENKEVEAGTMLGTIGKGDRNRYAAHLHFEVRLRGPGIIPPNYWPSAQLDRATAIDFVSKYYVDPMHWLAKVGAVPGPWAARQMQRVQAIRPPSKGQA